MDLDFSPEQLALRDTARALCAKACGLDLVRRLEHDDTGYAEAFWRQLGGTGLLGMAIPEEYGGSAMSTLDAVVVYEEFGRALAPSPHFVSAVMAAGALLRAGRAQQRGSWLPDLAAGRRVATVAWLEPEHGFGPAGVAMRATTGPAGRWLLSGTKWHVPFAAAADGLLVLARTGDGIGLFLADPRAPGTRIARQRTLTGDAQYAVAFDGASAEPVGPPGAGWPVWSEVLQNGLILLAAQAVGAARRALEMAVEHAGNRRQFGKPLGAFQAIGHYLADAAAVVDGVQTLVWEAAWARDAGRPVSRLAPMAKLAACDAFRDVTATAQQIFGGVGFTLDYDIQLYFRRAKQWQLSWCDARRLAELIADDLLGPVSPAVAP